MTARDDRARVEQPAPPPVMVDALIEAQREQSAPARPYHQLTEQEGGPPNERFPDPTAPEIAAAERRLSLEGSMELIREHYSEAIAALGEEREIPADEDGGTDR